MGSSQSTVARWESGRVVPSLERLRALVRACGFDLTYGLADRDDSYDTWILRALQLTPTERVADAQARARVHESIRKATGVRVVV